MKKETLAQVLFYEFRKISKNTFSYRTLLVATSDSLQLFVLESFVTVMILFYASRIP